MDAFVQNLKLFGHYYTTIRKLAILLQYFSYWSLTRTGAVLVPLFVEIGLLDWNFVLQETCFTVITFTVSRTSEGPEN